MTWLTPARTSWAFDSSGGWPADSSRDVFRSPGKPLFTVASQQLPAGMSPAEWLRSYVSGQTRANGGSSGSQTCWPAPKDWLTQRVGGHDVQIHGQSEYCAFTEAVTFEGDRAYVFTGFAGTLPGVFDMHRFRTFIRSARLSPGTASSDSTG